MKFSEMTSNQSTSGQFSRMWVKWTLRRPPPRPRFGRPKRATPGSQWLLMRGSLHPESFFGHTEKRECRDEGCRQEKLESRGLGNSGGWGRRRTCPACRAAEIRPPEVVISLVDQMIARPVGQQRGCRPEGFSPHNVVGRIHHIVVVVITWKPRRIVDRQCRSQ